MPFTAVEADRKRLLSSSRGEQLPEEDGEWTGEKMDTPVVQGRSTKVISTIKWIRTSRLSIKNSFSLDTPVLHGGGLGNWCVGCRVQGLGFWVWGLEFEVDG